MSVFITIHAVGGLFPLPYYHHIYAGYYTNPTAYIFPTLPLGTFRIAAHVFIDMYISLRISLPFACRCLFAILVLLLFAATHSRVAVRDCSETLRRRKSAFEDGFTAITTIYPTLTFGLRSLQTTFQAGFGHDGTAVVGDTAAVWVSTRRAG